MTVEFPDRVVIPPKISAAEVLGPADPPSAVAVLNEASVIAIVPFHDSVPTVLPAGVSPPINNAAVELAPAYIGTKTITTS